MLTRWDPFSQLESLQRGINRLFDDAAVGRSKRQGTDEVIWAPAVNTYEDKNEFVLFCDLPGVLQKEVKLKVENDILTLSGTRKLDHEDKRENYQRIECVFGTFSRSFTLPATVDPGKIDASMNKGVLTIRLPKREESKPKQIEIRGK